MDVYLEAYQPERGQFRKSRQSKATGAIVVHTIGTDLDLIYPDRGAEHIAESIVDGSLSGSHHSVIDSATILRLLSYDSEAFHEGTGGNRWSLSLVFAPKFDSWQKLSSSWVDEAILNGAQEARSMSDWVLATEGVRVPAKRISVEQYHEGQPGFLSSEDLESSASGGSLSHFPWTDFLDQFSQLTADTPASVVNRVNRIDARSLGVSHATEEVPNMLETASRAENVAKAGPSQLRQSEPYDEVLRPPSLIPSLTPDPSAIIDVDTPPSLAPSSELPVSNTRSIPYSVALDDIDELYRAYTGSRPPASVRRELARDLAVVAFVDGGSSFDFVAAVEVKLRMNQETDNSV